MTVESKTRMRFLALVIAFVAVSLGAVRSSAFQSTNYLIDPVMYDVYAAILPAVWGDCEMLLQAETESIERAATCLDTVIAVEPGWEDMAQAFRRANQNMRLLQPLIPTSAVYRLIPKAAVLSDDARLAIKYPGIWQRRPESLEYVAVSSVGFNDIKTKAVVYVRKRSSGGVHVRQFVNGEWVVPQLSKGCGGWIA